MLSGFPCVIWLTGLSGAGKTTIAQSLYKRMQDEQIPSELLDGDQIRQIFPTTGFSHAERDMHIRRMGFLASRLEAHGVTVIASLISPYRDSRRFVRGLCKNFVEVYISTPLNVCEKRDPKGLYAKYRRGELKGFTGLDDPYEAPIEPQIEINTTDISVADSVQKILDFIQHVSQEGTYHEL